MSTIKYQQVQKYYQLKLINQTIFLSINIPISNNIVPSCRLSRIIIRTQMTLNNRALPVIVKLMCLLSLSQCFLEFTLVRNPSTNQLQQTQSPTDDCITKNTFKSKSKQGEDIEYDQLCYFKDISYSIQLYNNNKLHHIAIDLTSPYSWLKSYQCKLLSSAKPCHLIEQGEINHKKITHKKKLKTPLLDTQSNKHINQQQQTNQQQTQQNDNDQQPLRMNNKLARIEGSNQFVQGYLQQNKDIEFWTKDSGRLSRFFDILMLGFYMIEQKQKVALHKTNFINTTTLSQNMERLCDGALSLRFDQNSQNSFLQEIFDYTQTVDKIITIYINAKQSQLTIGQLSVKNTAQGYSGIVWIPFVDSQENTAYGKLPLVQSIMLESLNTYQQEDIEKDVDNNMFVVFSLSASYIGLPEIAMNQLAKQFQKKHKLDCAVSQHSYFQCTASHYKDQTLSENLLIVMKQGAISLPLQSILLKKSKKKLIFNLRLISKEQNEKQKSFIVLGEPYFQKYFTALDYRNNRVGFAVKRTGQHNNFISTVSLIRFVSFAFFAGCCFLVCFQPLKKMFETFSSRKQIYNRKSSQGRRLKYQPIEQNPYEQVADNLKRAMQENNDENE